MGAPSDQDFYDLGRIEILVRRPSLVIRDADVVDCVLWSGVAMASRLLGYSAGRVRATYLDGAQDADLTVEARDRGVEREVAVKSIGQVTFTRPGATGAGTIPAGFRVGSVPMSSGKFVTVVTDVNLVFGAAELSKSVACTAAVAGVDGNVQASLLTRLLDTPYDTTFTVTNAARFVGGYDEQSDPDLRDETKADWQTRARGTLAALERGARIVAQVVTSTVVEDTATSLVTLYVADIAGNSNQALLDAVTTELRNWRCGGGPVQVAGGVASLQSISVTLTVRAGVSIAALVARVRTAIAAAVNRLRIGDTLYRSLIADAARAVDRDNIVEVVVNTPAANIAPASPSQVFRTTVDLIAAA